MSAAQLCGYDRGITASQKPIMASASVGVGNGIALKQNCFHIAVPPLNKNGLFLKYSEKSIYLSKNVFIPFFKRIIDETVNREYNIKKQFGLKGLYA